MNEKIQTAGQEKFDAALDQLPAYVRQKMSDIAYATWVERSEQGSGDLWNSSQAASILAKTARDALMHNLDAKHPGYGFAKHKGYPVPEHLAALKALGACSIHRTSFGPVRSILGLPPLPPWPGQVEIAP